MSSVVSTLLTYLSDKPDTLHFDVCFSGGVDSTVLLHALSQAHPTNKIRAIHIDHGLHPDSEKWSQRCEKFCAQLSIECVVKRVQIEGPGNIEQKARKARYSIFETLLPKGAHLLMAHHLDDQVETFFLKAFSGAALQGLAGIPASRVLGVGTVDRPFLSLPKKACLEYALQHELSWIEDDSNESICFDRNWIRNVLLPLISNKYPGATSSIRLCQEKLLSAQHCLHDLAQADSPAKGMTLSLQTLQALPVHRQRNVLIQWCFEHFHQHPSWRQLNTFLHQCQKADNHAQLPVGEWIINRWHQTLYARPAVMPPVPDSYQWSSSEPLLVMGQWVQLPKEQASQLDSHTYDVHYWTKGVPEGISPSKHHLKNRFQLLGIPPWLRPYIPLITYQKKLVVPIETFSSYSPTWFCGA